jgi:dihydrofolate synthase/folylpolyglutamate synthase
VSFPARLALLGAHQRENAGTALAAVEELEALGFPIGPAAIQHGLATVRWPGRLELVPGRPPVLLDGAHNGESAERLADAVRALFPNRPVALVLGMARDKDLAAIVRALAPLARQAVATRAQSLRARDPDEIAAALRARGVPVAVAADAPSALKRAWRTAAPDDLVLVTGSLYLVAEARAALGLAAAP